MCGIAGIIGRLDEPNRAALERMSDAMVHRGPDAERDLGLRAGCPRMGRAAGAPPARDPRPLAGRRPAHGRPGDRARHHLQRRDLQLPRPAAAPGGRGTDSSSPPATRPSCCARSACTGRSAVSWLRGMFAFACWDPKQRRLLLAQGSPGHQAALRGTLVRSECGLVGGLRLGAARAAGLRTAGHAAPRSAGRGQLCVERLRGRPWHRRQGRRTALAGPAARVRRRRQGGPPGGLLAHPRPRARSDHGRGRPGRHPRGGAEAPPRQRRAPGGLPLRRRGLLGDGQPGPARRAEPDPHLHPGLRGAGAQRGADRAGGSPPRSAPSITRWC